MRAKSFMVFGASTVVITLAAWGAIRSFERFDGSPSSTRRGPSLIGTVFYRERIALPDGSIAEVILEDISVADRPAVEIARATIAPAGQVPIPFELRYPADQIAKDHRYAVRAAIRWPTGARMFVSAGQYSAFDGATRSDDLAILVQRVNEPAAGTDAARVLFECGSDVFFAMRFADGQATLSAPKFLGNDSIVLQQVEAASGARYVAGETVFWNKGELATFQIGGHTFIDCRAARSGR